MLGFMTEGKPIRFSMDIPESFPHVRADEKRFVQILFNLLHNAVKYTEEGTISISAETKGGQTVIHVSDTGIGMDEDTQSRVLCNILSTEQYDIGTAVSGREAIGMLDAEQWDLIIADPFFCNELKNRSDEGRDEAGAQIDMKSS